MFEFGFFNLGNMIVDFQNLFQVFINSCFFLLVYRGQAQRHQPVIVPKKPPSFCHCGPFYLLFISACCRLLLIWNSTRASVHSLSRSKRYNSNVPQVLQHGNRTLVLVVGHTRNCFALHLFALYILVCLYLYNLFIYVYAYCCVLALWFPVMQHILWVSKLQHMHYL